MGLPAGCVVVSDLQFLQDLDTLPTDHYLHDAAIDVVPWRKLPTPCSLSRSTAWCPESVGSSSQHSRSATSQFSEKWTARRLEKYIPFGLIHSSSQGRVCSVLHVVRSLLYPKWADVLAWYRRTVVYLDHFRVRKSSFSKGC